MSDLISRQAAIDALNVLVKDGHAYVNGAFFETILRDEAKRVLEELPSAQPKMKCIANVTMTDEQVKEAFEKAKCELLAAQPDHIRCRDCKHAEFKPGATIHCKELGADLYQWDYCSYAERRTDESNV